MTPNPAQPLSAPPPQPRTAERRDLLSAHERGSVHQRLARAEELIEQLLRRGT